MKTKKEKETSEMATPDRKRKKDLNKIKRLLSGKEKTGRWPDPDRSARQAKGEEISNSQPDQERIVRENEVLRLSNAALELKFQRFKAILYSIGDAIIATDKSGIIVQMNRVAEQLTGWPEAEALGRTAAEVFRIVNEESGAEVNSPVARVLAEGSVVGLANHTLLIARNGTQRPIADSGAPIRDENGKVTGVVIVFRDQTEERAAQRALQESERKFHDAIRYLDEGYYSCTPEGLLKEHNMAFNRIFGFKQDEDLRGSRLPDFWQNPDDRKEYLDELIAKGYIRNYLINAKTIRGEKLVVMANSHLVKDENNTPTGIEGTFTDFTERKRMEEALTQHRDHLEDLVAARTAELQWSKELLNETGRLARVGGWEIDLLKNELNWTDVVRQIHEVGPDFRPTVEAGINFYAPEAVPVISEAVRRAIEEGMPFDVELQLINAKKKRLWVRAVGEAIRENGKIVKVRGVFQDIHERKLAEDELKKHRDHLEELVNKRTEELRENQEALIEAQSVARRGNWEWDAVRDEITASAEFYRLFAVAPEEIIRFSQFIERLHSDDRERVQQDVAAALKRDRPYDTDYRVMLHNGGWRDINARGRIVTDTDGKPLRMMGTCLDITERKRAEEALAESEKKLRTLFETMSEGIVYEDHAGNIISANPAAERLLGLSLDQMQGRTSLDPRWKSIHEDGSPFPGETHSLRVAAMTGKPGHDEIQGIYNPKSGAYIWLNINSTPEFLPGEKEPYRAYAVFRDITERKQAEKQLKALNENLERSNKELEQFAYVASHDLQEPLRMVSSYTQLLEQRYKDKLDQDAKDFIGYAVDGANRMQRLIQDLLEYSRITTRGQPLALLDGHEVLGEAIKNLQAAIQESGALVTSNDLPMVLGDRTQIVQVFQNLIGNGIKFKRPDVAPLIHISAEDDLHNNRFRLFKVRDNGIGIEPRHFGRLFEIFQRLNSKKEYPGTGIGLALCKRIVERHGGRIWVESEPGKGASFLFTLPGEGHNSKGEQK
jgi:PAS domain S-box-containing protein